MSRDIGYIKVSKLFKDELSSKEGDRLAYEIKNNKFRQIGIDWENIGSILNISFIHGYLDSLRHSRKKLINFNLSEDELNYNIRPFIRDPNEKPLFMFFENLDDYEFINENTLRRRE